MSSSFSISSSSAVGTVMVVGMLVVSVRKVVLAVVIVGERGEGVRRGERGEGEAVEL